MEPRASEEDHGGVRQEPTRSHDQRDWVPARSCNQKKAPLARKQFGRSHPRGASPGSRKASRPARKCTKTRRPAEGLVTARSMSLLNEPSPPEALQQSSVGPSHALTPSSRWADRKSTKATTAVGYSTAANCSRRRHCVVARPPGGRENRAQAPSSHDGGSPASKEAYFTVRFNKTY